MVPPRAYSFIFLNILRTLGIIALLLVFSLRSFAASSSSHSRRNRSNIVILVHDVQAVNRFQAGRTQIIDATNATAEEILHADYILGSTVPNQAAGVFWAVLNRLLIIAQVIILLLSEIGWPAVFFQRFFPVLGKDFGVGALGLIQCLLGAAILSHRVDRFSLVAAFFMFSIGCLNIFVGLIFQESAKAKRSFTEWREQSKGALPTHVAGVDIRPTPPSIVSNVSSAFSRDEKAPSYTGNEGKIGFGFGVQGEKAVGLRGYLISKPVDSLPRYTPTRSQGS
ncbi:hypothetical protein MIND_00944600 [Mycena indigotica]|uniref:DUF7598 domain-containing protein n=1 Tax=Mycena indigotica TaxID=2126181 RepID=A0A8H6SEY4_9AGAR|nr:uncharacterized protein MIND_00944600 [Mycena indigotica]KAF7297117.1 hypothetical protein MIND_00944600 [Mycena indigotica]